MNFKVQISMQEYQNDLEPFVTGITHIRKF